MTTSNDAKAASDAESPEAMLKAAVSGKATGGETKADGGKANLPVLFSKPAGAPGKARFDARAFGLAGAALAIGTVLGVGATSLSAHRDDGARTALADTGAALESNRVEAARLNGEIETMARTLAALREAGEGLRADLRARETALSEKMTKLDQSLSGKVATLGERLEQGAREQSGKLAALTAQIEKRAAPAPVAALAAPAPKAEPAQTGAIPETKKAAEKPPVVEGWALRDVYDGTAVLEDRRRRLFEAVLGENIPGVGRVEAIERRGREWVVVTKQGVITQQAW
ncbi:hypothetical protein [Methylobacterium sp. sgz302541]|uniref:hypothetical protein n=1 Tax=unclassified Methylobacterium TaxID=2615210 RepID=UPI003D334A20